MFVNLIFRILSLPLIPFRRYLPPSPPSSLPRTRKLLPQAEQPSPSPPLLKSTAMYVYLGKLDWKPYGLDETFVITLPNGPARAGDPAYLFSQWTKDARGTEKANWFLDLVVDKVSKTQSGDDVFTLKNSHYYSWEITSQKVYGELKVTMSNPNKDKSTLTLNRIWKSESEVPSGSLRIWTGKINWPSYATNEMATFIVPEGFGKDKPVLAVWQWTKNGQNKPKNPNVHVAKQSILAGPEKSVKFEYDSFYHLTCTWQENTERLAVHMKGSGIESNVSKDLGEFALAAHYDRHSHDFNPPESTPNKSEVYHRLPQTQPSLPRILAPMPFPRGLVDTLTHAQAFIDQAGYLAKYAEDRFKALDSDLHIRDHQLAAAETEIRELTKNRDILASDDKEQKAKIVALAERLQKAQEEAKKQEAVVAKLQNALNDGQKHDAQDHQEIEDLRAARIQLKRELDQALPALAGARAKVVTLSEEIQRLKAAKKAALSELAIQQKLNKTLTEEIEQLKKANKQLRDDLEPLREDNKRLSNEVEYKKAAIDRKDAELKTVRAQKFTADSQVKDIGDKFDAIEKEKNRYWDVLNKHRLLQEIQIV
ncbi:hypothetical protein CORC01_06253 [Colletotrichum orchidophilum]|uniref:Uncharacterized protein n=1 Tax=Colletotrichum orchidophilum TaxID=1209926 RepID=A0A1G4BAY5_9PEZI|nr:uncharacterized protein CORC01_06253 [Colletotrichum orchidophilum]OHE98462.1 hypothetical protein CORC01_06253 [Colletotrichum orchidophilum]